MLALICAAVMVMSLAGCGGNSTTTTTQAPAQTSAAAETATQTQTPEPAEKTWVVGICQLAPHPALDAATQGFKDALVEALGDKVEFLDQNAAGDSNTCGTIVNGFVSNNVDLILANATPALQAAASATGTIPILGRQIRNVPPKSAKTWVNTQGVF